jgi:hypothetical protein
MLHAYIERFDVMGGRGNILGWDGEVNPASVCTLYSVVRSSKVSLRQSMYFEKFCKVENSESKVFHFNFEAFWFGPCWKRLQATGRARLLARFHASRFPRLLVSHVHRVRVTRMSPVLSDCTREPYVPAWRHPSSCSCGYGGLVSFNTYNI